MRWRWTLCILLALAACSGREPASGLDIDAQIVFRDGAQPVLERYLKALDASQVTLSMVELDYRVDGYPRYMLLLDVIGSSRLAGPRSNLKAAAARLDELLLEAVEYSYMYPRREIYLREHAGGVPADTLLVFGLADTREETPEDEWDPEAYLDEYDEAEYQEVEEE
ncbi:MAG: hypothetical protein NW241_12735 [Bacteroidia bacterium]|nr:hypothetical protein [Bacteroidia bacterium]